MTEGVHAACMQCVYLSAQHSGQQGHSDVHAVLCLTEICRPRVCVYLHTERKTEERRESEEKGRVCDAHD